MRRRVLAYIGLAAIFIAAKADNCVLDTKEVEVPVRDGETITFTTMGDQEHSGSETIDFTGTLLEIEEDNEFVQLLDADIENAYWRVLENRGDPNLIITGSVTVTRLAAKPGVFDAAQTTQPLIEYTSVPIDSVTGETFHVAPLSTAGVALLNAGFAEYLEARAAQALGNPVPLPDLQFRFDWEGTASAGGDAVDFDWQARVKFILTGLIEVEVPDL